MNYNTTVQAQMNLFNKTCFFFKLCSHFIKKNTEDISISILFKFTFKVHDCLNPKRYNIYNICHNFATLTQLAVAGHICGTC